MSAAMIDTHSVIKRLIAAGMPEGQAETVTTVIRESRDDMAGAVATKADIAEVKAEISRVESTLNARITGVETSVKSQILEETAPIKAQLLLMKWMLGFVLAFQIAIFVRMFLH